MRTTDVAPALRLRCPYTMPLRLLSTAFTSIAIDMNDIKIITTDRY